MSRLTPVIRFDGRSLELLLDRRGLPPILRIRGSKARELFAILSRKYDGVRVDSDAELLIPLQHLPAVSVWLLSTLTTKPSEETLDRLVESTPRILADVVWELVRLSGARSDKGRRMAMIDYKMALVGSKIVKEMLKLYKLL